MISFVSFEIKNVNKSGNLSTYFFGRFDFFFNIIYPYRKIRFSLTKRYRFVFFIKARIHILDYLHLHFNTNNLMPIVTVSHSDNLSWITIYSACFHNGSNETVMVGLSILICYLTHYLQKISLE